MKTSCHIGDTQRLQELIDDYNKCITSIVATIKSAEFLKDKSISIEQLDLLRSRRIAAQKAIKSSNMKAKKIYDEYTALLEEAKDAL